MVMTKSYHNLFPPVSVHYYDKENHADNDDDDDDGNDGDDLTTLCLARTTSSLHPEL